MKQFIFLTIVFFIQACNPQNAIQTNTFESDIDFLNTYSNPIVLASQDGMQQIIVAPDYQGRVMTSTATGKPGKSHGWINRKFIEAGLEDPNINPYGGEDRLWIGPLGSQFSLYYQGKEFDDIYWHVPHDFDRKPFEVVDQRTDFVHMKSKMNFSNFIGTEFNIKTERTINLLSIRQIETAFKMELPENVKAVGFESVNTMTNLGEDWDYEKGTLALWSLGQFLGNEQTMIIIPYTSKDASKVVNTYLAEIPDERLMITEDAVLFKADGKFRSKIGIPPQHTISTFGVLDLKNDVLTIVQFQFENEERYFNSDLGHQVNPYNGDVVSIYNNDPETIDGTQGHSFYELESASSMKALKKDEEMTHYHRTIHIEGDQTTLIELASSLLGVKENTITKLEAGK